MWIIIVHVHVHLWNFLSIWVCCWWDDRCSPEGSPPWPGLGHQSVPGQSIVWCGGDKSKDGWGGVHQYHHPRTVGTDQPQQREPSIHYSSMESRPSTYQQPVPLASMPWSVWPSIDVPPPTDLLPKVASKITAQRTEPISAAVTNWSKLQNKSSVVISPLPSKCLLASV